MHSGQHFTGVWLFNCCDFDLLPKKFKLKEKCGCVCQKTVSLRMYKCVMVGSSLGITGGRWPEAPARMVDINLDSLRKHVDQKCSVVSSDHGKRQQQLFTATEKQTMERDNSSSKGTVLYSIPELSK